MPDTDTFMENNKERPEERFRVLLKKYRNKQCTRDELYEFFDYIRKGECRDVLEEEMHDDYRSGVPSARVHRIDWETVYSNIISQPKQKGTRRLFSRWLSVAAAVVAVLGAVAFLLLREGTSVSDEPRTALKKDVAPGGNKAVLTLGNGTLVRLNQVDNGALDTVGNTVINKASSGTLVYHQGNALSSAPAVQTNTLTIPRGGQFKVILPDQSKVWLNAGSSLTYPTAFTGSDRSVELAGEAYFEVSKDKARPFLVKSGKATVEVLGTHFNVMTYKDAPHSEVTLAEGSVRLHLENTEVMLKPGQKALFDSQSRYVSLKEVDPEEATDWKNGYFQFDNTGIEEVMNKISRWYNVGITYSGKKPQVLFTGMISRNNNISKILTLLEKSGGVKFEIDDQQIIVKSKVN